MELQLQPLNASSLLAWVVIDLILTSLFGAIILINTFILSGRLHRLEKHTTLDREAGHRDVNVLDKFRDPQILKLKKEQFDEPAVRAFLNLNGENDRTSTTSKDDRKSPKRHEAIVETVAKVSHLAKSETQVKKNEDDAAECPPDYSATEPCAEHQDVASGITEETCDPDSYDAQSEKFSLPDPHLPEEIQDALSGYVEPVCSGCSKKSDSGSVWCGGFQGLGRPRCQKRWCWSCSNKIYAATASLGEMSEVICACGNPLETLESTWMTWSQARQLLNAFNQALEWSEKEVLEHPVCITIDFSRGKAEYATYQLILESGQMRVSEGSRPKNYVTPEEERAEAMAAKQGIPPPTTSSGKKHSQKKCSCASSEYLLPPKSCPLGALYPSSDHAWAPTPRRDNRSNIVPPYHDDDAFPTRINRPSETENDDFNNDDSINDSHPSAVQAAELSEWQPRSQEDSADDPSTG